MRELAAPDAPIRVPVSVACRVLKLHRQHYYAWLAQPVTDAELAQAYRADAIFDAHLDDPEFGYRFLADEVRSAGHEVSERTVWKICSANGWWSVFGKKRRGKKVRVGAPAHDDLVRPQFRADGPNKVWLTDITEHRTGEGKLYLCAVKDVWSNRIVGYSISDRMESAIAVNALESAVARRAGSVAGYVVHSDRAGQYLSIAYTERLEDAGALASVGSRGDSYDNAAAESVFGLYKTELIRRRGPWRGLDDVELATLEWVDWFNHRRLHSYCADSPPAEFEQHYYRQNTGLEALQPGEPSLH